MVGIPTDRALTSIEHRDKQLVVAINTHCTTLGMPPDIQLSTHCDDEFLYIESPYFRRYLSRFLSFTLGQINHHE